MAFPNLLDTENRGERWAALDALARRAVDPLAPTTVSYEQLLEWADEDTHAEWVDGKIEMSSPARLRHQLVMGFLYRVVSAFVDVFELGSLVLPPFQMKLSNSGREPDLVYLSREHADRLRTVFVDGAADMALEILSDESAGRDREIKRAEYQRAGVGEYWLIDPRPRGVASFLQFEQGIYREVLRGRSGIFHSRALPGFWLDAGWLYAAPLPSVERTLYAIAGDAYTRYFADQLKPERSG